MTIAEVTHNTEKITVYYDGESVFFRRADINRIFSGNFANFTDKFFIMDKPDIKSGKVPVSVIKGNDLLYAANELYKDVLEGDRRKFKNILSRINTLTKFVENAQNTFSVDNIPKTEKVRKVKEQHFTDRKKCKNCRYAYFKSFGNGTKFMWCNYFEYTNMNRPHDGCKCFGYKPREK